MRFFIPAQLLHSKQSALSGGSMAANNLPTSPKREGMGKTLHPLVRPNVLELPRGYGMTSHSSHMKGTEPRPVTRSELSLTDGVPQQLTSQLRSLSLVTVRSAKSPRLTSPPPIVSMMKTSEEKPKEPGRGGGGVGQTGPGKEKEAERGGKDEDRKSVV